MQVRCPNCQKSVPASAINLERLLAKCDDCNRLFDCSTQLPSAPAHGRQRWRAPVALPEGMHIEVAGGTVKLERRWYPTATGLWFKAIFAVAWCGFLVVWYDNALSRPLSQGVDWLMVLFPMIHVAVGVGLIYSVLSDILNTTTITADAQTLTIRHSPLPARGSKQIPVAGLQQLYCKEVRAKTRNQDGTSSTGYTYSVIACFTDGRETKLVETLPNTEQALFIEQQLEAHLHIIDVYVDGELDE
jgi:hypothetical protein